MSQFAVINHNGQATIVSSTERGAKCYATLNGYGMVCKVSPYSMSCYDLKQKQGKKWVSIQN